MFSELAQHLRGLVTQPVDELRGARRKLRYFIDFSKHCARRLSEDRAEEMAAALAYRTIFSLIPLVVLGLVMFRTFGGLEDMHGQLELGLYEFFGIPETAYGDEDVQPGDQSLVEAPDLAEEIEEEKQELAVEAGAAPADATAEHERKREDRQVKASIQRALTELTAKVANLDLASIGLIGVILFIYAAVALAVSMERDFNIVFNSPHGRRWGLRIPIYWSMLTLGSGLLASSLYLTGQFIAWVGDLGFYSFLVKLLSRLLALLASWVLLYLLYALMPNTKVEHKPALIGSFVAAVLWEIGKFGFQIYVRTAVPYSNLYGSLGLVPLFLFWVYCSWLIVLFGLEIAYTLQVMPRTWAVKVEEEPPQRLSGDPDWMVPILAEIGHCFASGETIGRQKLSDHLGLPSRVVNEFAAELEKAGLIHMLNVGTDVQFTLARPPDKIAIVDVLELGRQIAHAQQMIERPNGAILDKLFQAKLEAAGESTLAQLIDDADRPLTRVFTGGAAESP